MFWTEVSNKKGGENGSRIKDGKGRLAQGEDEVLIQAELSTYILLIPLNS